MALLYMMIVAALQLRYPVLNSMHNVYHLNRSPSIVVWWLGLRPIETRVGGYCALCSGVSWISTDHYLHPPERYLLLLANRNSPRPSGVCIRDMIQSPVPHGAIFWSRTRLCKKASVVVVVSNTCFRIVAYCYIIQYQLKHNPMYSIQSSKLDPSSEGPSSGIHSIVEWRS